MSDDHARIVELETDVKKLSATVSEATGGAKALKIMAGIISAVVSLAVSITYALMAATK